MWPCTNDFKSQLIAGVVAVFWSIWLSRNDIVFNKHHPDVTIMQAISRSTYLLRFWRLLRREDQQKGMLKTCRALEVVAIQVFAKHGWPCNQSTHSLLHRRSFSS
uniref:Uncharacterized protein n=1 Tax=Setaria viridis TaxID=4556 RepID=A0A4U6WJ95_SETVI|nr:hypothetical protein SEVIR_1G319100v2 [Setaria viridis]